MSLTTGVTRLPVTTGVKKRVRRRTRKEMKEKKLAKRLNETLASQADQFPGEGNPDPVSASGLASKF